MPIGKQLLEVRVGKEQIKAKQIQIEFIQVEHLPGSSESRTRSNLKVAKWSLYNSSSRSFSDRIAYQRLVSFKRFGMGIRDECTFLRCSVRDLAN